jgi:hypothetical protein
MLSLNLLWAGTWVPQPKFVVMIRVFCSALPHLDVDRSAGWIRLSPWQTLEPLLETPATPKTQSVFAARMQNCSSHSPTMLTCHSHRLGTRLVTTYIRSNWRLYNHYQNIINATVYIAYNRFGKNMNP